MRLHRLNDQRIGKPGNVKARATAAERCPPKKQGQLVWAGDVLHLSKLRVLVGGQGQALSVFADKNDLMIPQPFTHHVRPQDLRPRIGIVQPDGAKL